MLPVQMCGVLISFTHICMDKSLCGFLGTKDEELDFMKIAEREKKKPNSSMSRTPFHMMLALRTRLTSEELSLYERDLTLFLSSPKRDIKQVISI